jgi:hypothetical protein
MGQVRCGGGVKTCSCYVVILVVGASYCMLTCMAGVYEGWGEVGWGCREEWGGVGSINR